VKPGGVLAVPRAGSNSAQISQLVMTGHLNSKGAKDKLH
jgi:hypothetical protein